jgi:uncharacterized protein DUF3800
MRNARRVATEDCDERALHYYVDESGDGVIFNRRGRVIIGDKSQSHFILGLAVIDDPVALEEDVNDLRLTLLSDDWFSRIPSMQPHTGKTAKIFHAKDDVPEVRREVFRLILRHEIKFLAVVKRMPQVLDYVRSRMETHADYRYHPNELYDLTVRLLLRNMLHKHDVYRIHFARRGKSDRTRALQAAVETARDQFCERYQISHSSLIHIVARYPWQEAGLQVTDYFLWALQRLYERHEDRYIEFLWPKVSLVRDVDDQREKEYGVYYTGKKPLTLAALR